MSTTSNRILSVYKSRKNVLELLEKQGFNTSQYSNFSINEIDAMHSNNQLDMLVTNDGSQQKAYVKYYLTTKQIKPDGLDDIIEDLFDIENVLTKTDILIIIIEDEPNDTIITKIKYLYDRNGIFVVIHNIKRLQFNILNHKLVPNCKILGDDEVNELKKKYKMENVSQLPEISRFDPQALAICMRPGQVVKFERESLTALKYDYYRVCV
uniref:RNA polymerase subunit H/Rpb5 C-terminal domain-containing protein n=1 Tax=viral metagenome TaxID=1070528 RepID=A0A6C0B8Q8_9ZZZZ